MSPVIEQRLLGEVQDALDRLANPARGLELLHVVQIRPELWLRSGTLTGSSSPLADARGELETTILAAVLRRPTTLRVRRLLLYDLPSDLSPRERHARLSRDLATWRAEVTRGLTALGLRSDRDGRGTSQPNLEVRVVIHGRADAEQDEAELPEEGIFWGLRGARVPAFIRTWDRAARDVTRASLNDLIPYEDRHPASVVQRSS